VFYLCFFFLKRSEAKARSSKAGAMFAPSILLLTNSTRLSYFLWRAGGLLFLWFHVFFFLVIICKPLLLGLIHFDLYMYTWQRNWDACSVQHDVMDLWIGSRLYARMMKQ
jgi:hypothetical protein